MSMNPMQRKANNYLLIGVLVTLLITGSIIAILFMQLSKVNKQMKSQQAKMKEVYVVSKDINSGDAISMSNLKKVLATSDAIPNNAVNVGSITEETVAKIDLKVGTVITETMINEISEQTTADLRVQEYNMISLPTQIQNGDYIDIRLRLPDGTDYIVVSKKKVEIPTINDVESANTIKINVAEEEILLMSNAIVEAYYIKGTRLYATTYAEPGMQEQASSTYLPNDKVVQLMNVNPNILAVAKSELFTRYNNNASLIRGNITNNLNSNAEDGMDNIQEGVQEEITRAIEQRQSYLDALGGY